MNDVLLAIDTSTSALSIALKSNGQIMERHEVVPRAHGKLILNWIEQLLALAQLEKSALQGVVVGFGPGGFTGIRIGLGVAQGIAAGLDIPLVGLSSLQAMAHFALSQFEQKRVLVAQDAKMGEVYWAAYQQQADGNVIAIVPDQLAKPDEVSVPDQQGSWLAIGDAWSVYPNELNECCSNLQIHIEAQMYPHAHSLLVLGEPLLAAGQGQEPESVLPVYLRGESAWKQQPNRK